MISDSEDLPMRKLKPSPNPRAKVKNWEKLLDKVESLRSTYGVSIAEACLHVGISPNSHYLWTQRRKERT